MLRGAKAEYNSARFFAERLSDSREQYINEVYKRAKEGFGNYAIPQLESLRSPLARNASLDLKQILEAKPKTNYRTFAQVVVYILTFIFTILVLIENNFTGATIGTSLQRKFVIPIAFMFIILSFYLLLRKHKQ